MPSDVETFAVGIDPGLEGAIALIKKVSDTQFSLINCYRLPMDEGGNLQVRTFSGLVEGCVSGGATITLEQAVASKFVFIKKGERRQMSADSAWRVGYNFGRMTASLSMRGLQFDTVMPRTWTSLLHKGLPRTLSAKDKSLTVFQRLCTVDTFHKAVPGRCTRPHSGIIDAALIAWWTLTR